MLRKLLMTGSALALAGCINQSQIQSKYTAQQDLCRAEVAGALTAGASVSAEGQAMAAGVQFSECMNKSGWHVAMPKGTLPITNPPSGSPSTNPHAAAAAAPVGTIAPSEGTAAITRQAVRPVANPPSGSPSVAPSAAARVAVSPAPSNAVADPNVPPYARYQPARPAQTPGVDYGTGAGRQF